MLKRIIITVLLLLFMSAPAWAKHKHLEKWYQQQWCAEHHGKTEVVLAGGTRCDCLAGNYAIEFDFGSKWAESIGQSLFYGFQTGKQPGIVLILESIHDRTFWLRLNSTIDHYHLPIKTWVIENYKN